MIRDRSKFLSLIPIEGSQVTFGDNFKGKVISKDKVDKTPKIYIDNVLLARGFKYNLFNISQFYDKGNKVTFDFNYYIVWEPNW